MVEYLLERLDEKNDDDSKLSDRLKAIEPITNPIADVA